MKHSSLQSICAERVDMTAKLKSRAFYQRSNINSQAVGSSRYSGRKRGKGAILRTLKHTGAMSLTDADLLLLILGGNLNAAYWADAAVLSERLLTKFRTLGQVLNATAHELLAVNGVTQREVAALSAVALCIESVLRQAISQSPIICDREDLYRYLVARLRHQRVEVFFVLYLDCQHRLIADEELTRGTL